MQKYFQVKGSGLFLQTSGAGLQHRSQYSYKRGTPRSVTCFPPCFNCSESEKHIWSTSPGTSEAHLQAHPLFSVSQRGVVSAGTTCMLAETRVKPGQSACPKTHAAGVPGPQHLMSHCTGILLLGLCTSPDVDMAPHSSSSPHLSLASAQVLFSSSEHDVARAQGS